MPDLLFDVARRVEELSAGLPAGGALHANNNLSDLEDIPTARANLGLGPLSTMFPTGTAGSTTFLRGDGVWAATGSSGLAGSVANLVTAATSIDAYGTGITTGEFDIRSSRGASGAPSPLTLGDQLGKVGFAGQYDTTANHFHTLSSIAAYAAEGLDGTHGGTVLGFNVTNIADATAASVTPREIATLDAYGLVIAPSFTQTAASGYAQDSYNGSTSGHFADVTLISADSLVLISNAGFGSSGVVSIQTTAGHARLSFTGTSGGTILTGVNYVSGSGALFVGATVEKAVGYLGTALEINVDQTLNYTATNFQKPFTSMTSRIGLVFPRSVVNVEGTMRLAVNASSLLGVMPCFQSAMTITNDPAGASTLASQQGFNSVPSYLADAQHTGFWDTTTLTNFNHPGSGPNWHLGFTDGPVVAVTTGGLFDNFQSVGHYSYNFMLPGTHSLNRIGYFFADTNGQNPYSTYNGVLTGHFADVTLLSADTLVMVTNAQFPPGGGTISIETSTGRASCSYTGKSGVTSLTGVTYISGAGALFVGATVRVSVSSIATFTGTTVAIGSVPSSTTWSTTTGMPAAGAITVATSTGIGVITYTAKSSDGLTLTGCAYLDGSGNLVQNVSHGNAGRGLVDQQVGLMVGHLQPDGVTLSPLGGAVNNYGAWIAGQILGYPSDAYYRSQPWPQGFVSINSTFTLDFTNGSMGSYIGYFGTTILKKSAGAFGMVSGFTMAGTYTNANLIGGAGNGVVANLGPAYLFLASGTFQADGASITGGISVDMISGPIYKTANSGTLTAAGHTFLQSNLTVNSGATLTTRYGLDYRDTTGAGTNTAQTAIRIPALSGATTNIGISNAASLLQSGPATFTGTVDLTGATVTGFSGWLIDGSVNTTSGLFNGVILRGVSSGPALAFQYAPTTNSGQTQSGDVLSSFAFNGSYDTTPHFNTSSQIRGVASENYTGANNGGGRLEFLTRPAASATAATIRGGWASSGLFYVGTTSGGAVASIDQTGLGSFTGVQVGATFTNLIDSASVANITAGIHATGGVFGLTYRGTEFSHSTCIIDLRSQGGADFTAFAATRANDVIAAFHVGGDDGTILKDAAAIECVSPALWTSSSTPTSWVFRTNPVGSSASRNVALTLGSDLSAVFTGALTTPTISGATTFDSVPTINVNGSSGMIIVRDTGAALATATALGVVTFEAAGNASHSLLIGGQMRMVSDQAFVTATPASGSRFEFLTMTNNAAAITVKAGIDNAGVFFVGTNGSRVATIDGSGNGVFNGTLGVTGATTLGTLGAAATTVSSTLGVTGIATFSAIPSVYVAGQSGLTMVRDAGAALGSGVLMSQILVRGAADASGTLYSSAGISFITDEAFATSGTHGGGRIVFLTTLNGTNSLSSTATIGMDNAGALYGGTNASRNWVITNAGAPTFAGPLVGTPIAPVTVTTGASTQIVASGLVVTINSGSALTLNATVATIAAGTHGQLLVVVNENTTAARTITFTSGATTNLSLSAATLAIGPRGSITLVYDSTISRWVQMGANVGGN